MINYNENYIIAKGGKGGLGNNHFKSSTNQAPRQSTNGESGTEICVWLSLKLFADVGIIGMPNAGKSTLLSKISSAHPKIADYPFTTLHPELGVVKDKQDDFIVADIPGLIRGAHKGKGLGYRFLAHIERCKILLHLLDINDDKYFNNYNMIRTELEKYGSNLSEKKEIIALSKTDRFIKEPKEIKKKVSNKTGKQTLLISSLSGEGLKELIELIKKSITKA